MFVVRYVLTAILSLMMWWSAAAAEMPVGPIKDVDVSEACARHYQRALNSAKCAYFKSFSKKCTKHPLHGAANAFLRLRCPDVWETIEYQTMKRAFQKARLANSCAAMTRFFERYSLNIKLVDTEELERAQGLQAEICRREARASEIAMLQAKLNKEIERPDCTRLKQFQRSNKAQLEPEQAVQLDEALNDRCRAEELANTNLKTCLDTARGQGKFCGLEQCYDHYRLALPGARSRERVLADQSRARGICNKYRIAERCISNDSCNAVSCLSDLRNTLGDTGFSSHIAKLERDNNATCERQRELARIREENEKYQRKMNATFHLTVCNKTSNRISVAIYHYHYDKEKWAVQGWWNVSAYDCTGIGRFTKGSIYFYGETRGRRFHWSGNDIKLCVRHPGPWLRVNRGGYKCRRNENLRSFFKREVNGSEFTQNLR